MPDSNADIRKSLVEERAGLLMQIDELTVGGEIDLEFDDDFSDRGQVASEKGENRSLADALQAQVHLLDRALTRIDDGTYGTCATCGEPIGEDRLEAVPATDRCIQHA